MSYSRPPKPKPGKNTTIYLKRRHFEFLAALDINLSQFVRDKLNEEIDVYYEQVKAVGDLSESLSMTKEMTKEWLLDQLNYTRYQLSKHPQDNGKINEEGQDELSVEV